jgi:hypothetical protein
MSVEFLGLIYVSANAAYLWFLWRVSGEGLQEGCVKCGFLCGCQCRGSNER